MADKGLDIVDKYNLEVVQVNRGRGAQVLHTADGLYILKEYKGRGSYINDEAVMLDALNASGQLCVDAYISDSEGVYINTSSDGQRYVVKNGMNVATVISEITETSRPQSGHLHICIKCS